MASALHWMVACALVLSSLPILINGPLLQKQDFEFPLALLSGLSADPSCICRVCGVSAD